MVFFKRWFKRKNKAEDQVEETAAVSTDDTAPAPVADVAEDTAEEDKAAEDKAAEAAKAEAAAKPKPQHSTRPSSGRADWNLDRCH